VPQSVIARNVGSSEIPAHGVVEISEAIKGDDGQIILEVRRPTSDSVAQWGVNIGRPLPVSSTVTGRVATDFPVLAKYNNANTPAAGEKWGPAQDSYELSKGNAGALIVGGIGTIESGTVAVIRDNGNPVIKCKTVTGITAGSSATVNVWRGGSITSPLETLTAYLDWAEGGVSISADKEIGVQLDDEGRYVVIFAECEATTPTTYSTTEADTLYNRIRILGGYGL